MRQRRPMWSFPGSWRRSRPPRLNGCGRWSTAMLEREVDLQRRVGEAASRGIAAGLSLAAIADAEQIGQRRAREEFGPELLRRVERAARRKREAEHEYEQAIVRAGRLGPRASGRRGGGAGGARHGARDHRPHADGLRAAAASTTTAAGDGVWAASRQTRPSWSTLRPSKRDHRRAGFWVTTAAKSSDGGR